MGHCGLVLIAGVIGAKAEQALAQITERREPLLQARAGLLEPAMAALGAMLAAR